MLSCRRIMVRSFCNTNTTKSIVKYTPPCNTELIQSINNLHKKIAAMEERIIHDSNIIFVHFMMWNTICFPTIVFCYQT
jgi:hypothetical protein